VKLRFKWGLLILFIAGVFAASHHYGIFSRRIDVPWFEVEVLLSTAAQEELCEREETIIVAAYLTGIPRSGSRYDDPAMCEFTLNESRVELGAQGVVRFEELQIEKRKLDALGDPDFEVLVNVFTGRRSDEKNLLDCTIVQKPISKIINKRHVVTGRLIRGEG